MTMFQSELSLSDGHYLAIGKIMAHWSMLEWHLKRVISLILGLPEREERALLAEIHLAELMRSARLVALLRLPDGDSLALLISLFDQIEEHIGERNMIAHALWARDSAGKLHIMKYKGGKDHEKRIIGEPVPMGDAEIDEIRSTAMRLSIALWLWIREWNASHAPSPDKSE